jgi:HEPN domain-containing protein
MKSDEALTRRREAARWLVIAAEDTRVAAACLRMRPPAIGVAAYHSHQAAEKLLKGLLITAAVDFRMTHDLVRLTAIVQPHYPELHETLELLRPLTSWGIAYRYPGPEFVTEPLPSGAEVERVLNLLGAVAMRLRALSAE